MATQIEQPGTPSEASAPTPGNGYDTTVLGGLVDALREHPEAGRVTFFSTSELRGGARVSTSLAGYRIDGQLYHQGERSFTLSSDEAVELGATDTAPSPPEQLMSALGSCIAATANAYAALKGVPVTRLEVALESDVDLHGLFALDPKVRPGLGELRARIRIEGDASEEALREIALLGYQFSLIRDSVHGGVPIRPEVEVVT